MRVLTLIAICLFTSAALSRPSQQTWLDPDFVFDSFIEVALKNEYQDNYQPLLKWRQPIKVWFEHYVPDEELHTELSKMHLEHLSDTTKHPISYAKNREEANVVWVFTQEKRWHEDVERLAGPEGAEHLHGAICNANIKARPSTYEIVEAYIVIPVDQARQHGKLLACIVEEITQVMGLPNDSESVFPSIFNDSSPEDLLSPLDVVLLSLLYEPELQSGMSRKEIEPKLRRLIKQYERDGVLKKAASQAKAAPLYQYIGY